MIPRLQEYLKHHIHDVTVEEVIDKIASPDVKVLFQDENPPDEDIIQSVIVAKDKLKEELKKYFEHHQIECLLMPANKITPHQPSVPSIQIIPSYSCPLLKTTIAQTFATTHLL